MIIGDFSNKGYDYVSYRLTLKGWDDKYLETDELAISNSIFAGCFTFDENGDIKSLDGDTYSKNEEVIWYEEWDNENEGIKKGLTVLVKTDWY